MSKYEELLNRKITTVGELKKALKKYSNDTLLRSSDADIGGYDISDANYMVIRKQINNTIAFGHLEYEAYQEVNDGNITYKQFEEISGENEL